MSSGWNESEGRDFLLFKVPKNASHRVYVGHSPHTLHGPCVVRDGSLRRSRGILTTAVPQVLLRSDRMRALTNGKSVCWIASVVQERAGVERTGEGRGPAVKAAFSNSES